MARQLLPFGLVARCVTSESPFLGDRATRQQHDSNKVPDLYKIPQISVWTNALQREAVSKYVLMANANSTMISARNKSKKDIAVPLAAAG